MHRRTFLTGLAAAALLPRVRARAGSPTLAPEVVGKWHDLAIDSEGYGVAKRVAPDAHERDAFVANVDAFVAVLKQHTAWKKPMGFDVKPTLTFQNAWSGEARPPTPIPGMLLIHCFW